MNIKHLIQEISSRLTWTVEHVKGNRDLEITSDLWSHTHTIYIPEHGGEVREIEYLHELAHATLAERHYLLSTAYFKSGTPEAAYRALTSPVRVASDWFADDLLMQWCWEEEAKEIREHAEYARMFDLREWEMIYGGGLSLAQEVYYLKAKSHDIPKRYRAVVDILLAVDPGKPSIPAKMNLINKLAALTCRQRVELTHDDGMDVWQVVTKK